MAKNNKNTAASVHQRLLNKAKETAHPFNELLQHFAIERFIYRLSKSPHANKFILKGALMFSPWAGPGSRPTMDIDLLGTIENSIEIIVNAIKTACEMEVAPDGMDFHSNSIIASRITEDAEYKGVRCRVPCNLGNARLILQIDIGFGDVIIPGPTEVVYPPLLDFPPPKLKGYTMESSIAEKFQIMVKLGILNSRMKDFYDIWYLCRTFNFKGKILAKAIEKTFENRNTPITVNPKVFDPSSLEDQAKRVQWLGFINKTNLSNAPGSFKDVATSVKVFLSPVAISLVENKTFNGLWTAPGPWH